MAARRARCTIKFIGDRVPAQRGRKWLRADDDRFPQSKPFSLSNAVKSVTDLPIEACYPPRTIAAAMVTMGIDIERRQFISALCSAMVAWLLSARSQQSAMPVVAVIDAGAATPTRAMWPAFRKGLSENGTVE